MSFRIYLSPPHQMGREKELVMDALESNWIAPIGPHLSQFEQEMSSHFGDGWHAVGLSSGTAALHLAIKYLQLPANATILCPSLTFVATANAAQYDQFPLAFVDSEPETWNMCPEALECAIQKLKSEGKKIGAALIVDLYGECAQYDKILPICEAHGIPVIEDAAEALGASYQGQKAGSFGYSSVFSFNGNKIITTSGGGMLLSQDESVIDKARFWAAQSRDSAMHYQHSEIGYNYRLSNILAALGRAQMEKLEDRVELRRQIRSNYQTLLSEIPEIQFKPTPSDSRPTFWLTTIMLDKHSKVTPAGLCNHLQGVGIEARPLWKPLHLQPLFEKVPMYATGNKPFCEDLYEAGVCLPSGSDLTPEDQNWVAEEIEKYFARNNR